MDISAFLTPPEIMSARRALCIQPHPDDNEIGMGGIVAALAAKGCEIHYLTVTNGDLGAQGGPIDPAELAVLRRQETVAAGEALGAKVFHFFDEPDGSLSDVPALAGKIAELVMSSSHELGNSPTAIGKSKNLWNSLFLTLSFYAQSHAKP